jgi:hypothetical protein
MDIDCLLRLVETQDYVLLLFVSSDPKVPLDSPNTYPSSILGGHAKS